MSDVVHEYDVVVIGGGSGGTMAAMTAAQQGKRVVMFNDGELGGLCILRGCMPTKTMLHAAHLVHEAGHHHTPGVARAELRVDFGEVMVNKAVKVERFKQAKLRSIEAGGYDVVDARARFVGADLVEAGGERYRFRSGAVIATGSVAHVAPIEGVHDVPFWTSDDVMALKEQPRSLVVVGSGAIGLEFAQFFARLGTEVTLCSRRKIFADVDPQIADEFAAVLASEPNFTALSEWRPLRFSRGAGEQIVVDVEGPTASRTIEAEALLLATGRRAAVDGLGLEAVGIELENGNFVFDWDMRTSNPRIFLAGDVTGERQLLHTANWEGQVAGLGAAQAEGEHRVEQRLHMEAVFTDPPLATVGLNEKAALAAGYDVITTSERLASTGRAITMDVQHGVIKLVADRSTGEILGGQFLMPRADDIGHVLSTLMYYRGTAKQMLEMPWYHPTLTEVLLSLARGLDSQVVAAGS